jgi:hypothetical protein
MLLMRTPSLFLFAVAALSIALPRAARADPKEDAERIGRLIAQLGSPQYGEREEASRDLAACGTAALKALRRAAQSGDPEVSRRAVVLVRRMERRLETDRLLAPQRMRLEFRDTPLPEAVAAFARRTGYPIKLEGDDGKLAERKVTLDTGDTTFWPAFDRFCAAAGLVERGPAPAGEAPNPNGVSQSSVIIVNGNMRAQPTDILNGQATDRPEPLVLVDGPTRSLPAHVAGALRLEALPPDTHLPGQPKVEGEAVLALEASVEPRLKWHKVLDLRIDRLTDDQDQALTARVVPSAKAAAQRDRAAMFINGVPVYPEVDPSETDSRQLLLRVRLGKKPAKELRELAGTLTALVRTEPQTLVTVEKILEAAGHTFDGAAGGSVKVVEVSRQEEGTIKLRLHVETPPRSLEDGLTVPSNMVMIVNGRRVGGDEEPLTAANFALLDAQGHPFEVVKAITTGRRAGVARELELTYQPAEGQGDPVRFVYTGRRSALVDVPFTLKHVPLP